MKSVLVISFSELDKDPRVFRQLEFLKGSYRLSTLGFTPPPLPGIDHHPWQRPQKSSLRRVASALQLKLGFDEAYYWDKPMRSLAASFAGKRFDLVIANDTDTLPLAFRLAAGSPVLCDAHEYSPLEFEDSFLWKFFYTGHRLRICRRYLPRCAAVSTVGEGIAAEYRRRFGVAPVVITNATRYHDLSPKPPEPGQVKMIHHGAAIPSRQLERMVHLMEMLDPRYSLDFMLVPNDPRYLAHLQELAKPNRRIRFLPPCPMPDIPVRINGYDIGLFLLPPTNFNYAHALPNKLFEFLQARLAIAIGPTPEMAAIVSRHECGVVAADFSEAALAAELNHLTLDTIRLCKENAHRAAAIYCAENNAKILRGLVGASLGE